MSNLGITHHCLLCGSPLELQLLDQRQRETCPTCGWVYYPQLKVGAGMLVEQDGKLLLLQRSHDPWAGRWNLPAGYVEADENPARAAERETLEETGLTVRATRLVNACFFDDDPRGNGVMLVYAGEVVGGSPIGSPETLAWRYFSPDEIPAELAGGGDDRIITGWKNIQLALAGGGHDKAILQWKDSGDGAVEKSASEQCSK